MRKQILSMSLLLACAQAIAQPTIKGNNTSPLNFNDIIAAYEASEKQKDVNAHNYEPKDEKHLEEGNEELFGRWKWYWAQHLDENGNIVSPIKNQEEWEAIQTAGTANKSTANQSAWSFVGPDNSLGGYEGIGRVNTMAFHPSNTNTYWIGSDGGGAWKTTNNGATWTPVADHLPMLSVSDIDFNPTNPNTVYMCTGDRDGRSYFSIGVLKSTDGGQTWNNTGLSYTTSQLRYTNCLLINPQDTNMLLLAASDGIYKSTNGGGAWTNVQAGNFKQVLYKPNDPNTVYATTYFDLDNNISAQIYRSVNGGNTWTQVTSYTEAMRIQLAVTPAAPGMVKALVASYNWNNYKGLDGIYNSSNSGASFSLQFSNNFCSTNILSNNPFGNGCGGQGHYDLAMAINPADPDYIIVGGVNTWYSIDGGFTFDLMNQWTDWASNIAIVHADKHFMGFHPNNANRFFECNDGGIYRTDNPFSLFWDDISNGLGITEFYRNAVHSETPFVLGGAQDNGTKYLAVGGISGAITGGDGMDCLIDFSDTNIIYTGVQYGKIYRVDAQFGTADVISDNIPGQPTGAWITPYLQHPVDPHTLIAGYNEVFATNDEGFSWYPISQQFYTDILINRLAMNHADPQTIYVSLSDTNIIYYTHNFGGNWTNLAVPYNARISDIKVDPKNSGHIWVSFSGYTTHKVAEYKQGFGWSEMNTNLPNVPVSCIEVDTLSKMLYIGTDIGVFYRDTAMTQWELFNNQLPSVRVNDMGINYATSEIWAATYGRGMWRSAKQVDLSTPLSAKDMSMDIYPNPSKGAFSVSDKKLANKKVLVQLLDNSSRVVWKQQDRFDGSGKMNLDLSNVAKGVYMVEILAADKDAVRQKLVLY